MYKLESAVQEIRNAITTALNKAKSKNLLIFENIPDFEIEIPAESDHGNLSSNAALVGAKVFKTAPRKIAEIILENIEQNNENITKIEIAGPGFINFFLSPKFFSDALAEIKKLGENYGKSQYGQHKKVMIEFVSANPTGPMHMGNARLGALGDCLAAIMKTTGYDVYKEFYVNDAGNQIEKFALSLDVRYQQICKGKDFIEMPEDGYQGDDITELAKLFFNEHSDSYINQTEQIRKKALVDFALPKNISQMQKDMEKYKIIYDNWFYESSLYSSGSVNSIINQLNSSGLTYESGGSLWYKSTMFGCEKDDVLRRKNGNPTYFAADIAYHFNKFKTRGFDLCIDIWGADHHGHVARMKGAMEALGISKDRLHVILVQLVRLIKNGEIVRMSKRTGKSIQLADLITEVGANSARFIFNTKEANSGMDFDLDLAVKQDSQNPVFYVQYAHARICSIFRNLSSDETQAYKEKPVNLGSLSMPEEKNLIFFMAAYPRELEQAAKNYDPTKITKYIINLATLFHKFYSSHKVRCNDKNLMNARLFLCDCTRIIIKNTLNMFKIDAPEMMN